MSAPESSPADGADGVVGVVVVVGGPPAGGGYEELRAAVAQVAEVGRVIAGHVERSVLPALAQACADMAAALRPVLDALPVLVGADRARASAMERALRARRARGTGPAPRRLDGRRA